MIKNIVDGDIRVINSFVFLSFRDKQAHKNI